MRLAFMTLALLFIQMMMGCTGDGRFDHTGSVTHAATTANEGPRIILETMVSLEELRDVGNDLPALIRTDIGQRRLVDLKARFTRFISNPLTKNPDELYLLLETDPDDARWEEWGGAAGGMSGSPTLVFLNGEWRLAGALSFSVGTGRRRPPFPFIATPIDTMNNILFNKATEVSNALHGLDLDGIPIHPLTTLTVMDVGTKRFLERFGESLVPFLEFEEPLDVSTIDPGSEDGASLPIQAGSSIGVALMTGTTTMGAVGTVTAMSKDRFMAFGHPFTRRGTISLPLTTAPVFDIVSSGASHPNKVATLTNRIIGNVTYDLDPGIAGYLGQDPQMTPVRISLLSDSNPYSFTNHIARVTEGALLAVEMLIGATIQSALSNVRHGRIGSGSAEITMQMNFGADLLAQRHEILSSERNITDDVAMSASAMASVFAQSSLPFAIRSLREVTFSAAIREERADALIIGFDHDPEALIAGRTFEVHIRLIPWNGSEIEDILTLNIPADFPVGSATLEVGSGEASEETGVTAPVTTFAQMVEQFNHTHTRNTLWARLKSKTMPACTHAHCPICPVCESDAPCAPCDTACPCDLEAPSVISYHERKMDFHTHASVTSKTVTVKTSP